MTVINLARNLYHTYIKPTIDVDRMPFAHAISLKSRQSTVSDETIRKLTVIFNRHTGDKYYVQNARADLVLGRDIISRMRSGPSKEKLDLLLTNLENTLTQPGLQNKKLLNVHWNFNDLSSTQRQRIEDDVSLPRPRR